MGEIIAVPLLLLLIELYVFFKFQPLLGEKKQHSTFNLMVVGVAGLIWGGWYLMMRTNLTGGRLEKYIALFGIGGGAAFACVWLAVFFFVRNFYVFRGQSYRPGGFR